MKHEEAIDVKRPELTCLALKKGDTWEQVNELAKSEGRSISSYLRQLIKREYKKSKKQLTETK